MPPPNSSSSTPEGVEATTLIRSTLPSNSAVIAAKPAYGAQLQRSLDVLAYAYILCTYFSDSYSMLLIPRIMIQLAFLTPKPPPVPQILPPFLRKPLLISIIALNLFTVFIHILYPPQSSSRSIKYPIFPNDPAEAFGGYFNLPDAARSMLHGGWTSIEFIGEYPASIPRLLVYDTAVMLLQLALFSLGLLPFVNNHGDGVDTIDQIENDDCNLPPMSPEELETAVENNPYSQIPNSANLNSPLTSLTASISSNGGSTFTFNHSLFDNEEDYVVASVLSQNVNSPEARYSGRSVAGDIRLADSIIYSLRTMSTMPNLGTGTDTTTVSTTGTRSASQLFNNMRNEPNTTTTSPATIINPLNNEFIQRAMSSMNFNA
ncbi:hypothetical protein NADFUDRAFT_40505 [Nadsonia fulvescens var. elongata DSM 6958]|uniref:DUF1746 domain-containing protein n=1 Tax=Nadsonia fulvescens var. elongata DSM 6958 TaxID=857566 RepID=A0A1E3PPV3_9ASCO|nr:hypothetical protein NADFUDRAFT_40505 [Nadsonia fulvescens var. elongata DSM 6958]